LRDLMTRQGRATALWWLRSRHQHLLYAAARLRRRALGDHQRVVMVVGSYGKTTTTRAARAALGLPPSRWSELNANTLGEVAWSVMRELPWRRHAVVEAAAAVPGQIARYAEVLRPHATVVTWLGHEHVRAFGDLERLRDEKAAAVRALPRDGVAILNADDPHVRWMATQTRARIVWFGSSSDCDVRADQVELDWPHGMRLRLHAGGRSLSLGTRLLGRRTVHNLLAAVAVGLDAGRSLDEIATDLAELRPTRGRLQGASLTNGAMLIRDEYKATPETVSEALRLLAEVPAGRRIVVIGDLNNLPTAQSEPHFDSIGAAIGQVADLVLVVGSHLGDYLCGLRRAGLDDGQILHAEDVHAAIRILRGELTTGDVVLLKGQEDQRLGRIALGLERSDVRCARKTCRAYLQFCDDCPLLCHAG
jgi:UDP-N-acetylmuramoyl-tripeptide--D-alanyl-D-alanine ligase